ncbi:hypothetical protein R1flu_016777 [Riccia fluitans]|uniref:Uncharacterized protein n=1 Tax=Riccia fluitans TaxID=41844 RepID=A0ABD1YNB3_9MARC
MDLSAAGLRKLVDFPIKGECRRIVPPFEVEAQFLKLTGRKYKKDASCRIPKDGGLLSRQAYVVSSEIRGRLGRDRNDKTSAGKFREGWQSIVRIVRQGFLAKQATARHEPLLLEARNAFTHTRAEWDSEKGELVCEKEALKEELHKVKEMAVEAEQRSEAVRLRRRPCNSKGIGPNPHSYGADCPDNTGEVPKLKWELEAKQEELKRLQEADKKIRQRLKVARRKGRELEDELKTMPASIVVRAESKTLELIRSSKKWQISAYPVVFDPTDLIGWKSQWLQSLAHSARD